jgi:HYR domain/Bacterial Ig-like domain (group 2)
MNRLLHPVLRFCCVGILLAACTAVQAQTFTITPDLSNPQRASITFGGSMPGTSPGAQQHRIFLIGAVAGAVSSASVCTNTAAIGARTLLSASISGTNTLILGFSGPLATGAALSGAVTVDLNFPHTWSGGTSTSSWGVLASVAAGTWNNTAAPIALPVAGIGVTGNSASIADGSTGISASNNTDLGQVCVVGGPISQTFTIANPSATGSLTVSNITTANSVLFSVGIPGLFPIIVLPSSSTTFTISFDPTAVGVVGTTVSIQNNSCGATSNYTFDVQGGGINAPTAYNLSTTNSGNFCTGSTTSITQNGSQTGVSYQLYIGGINPTGAPVTGTGSPLTFSGLNTSGVYTVVATATGGCTATMTGSVTLTERPLPALPTTTAYSVCVGGTRTLTGATGASHLWTVAANTSTGATINGVALTPPTQTFSTQNLAAVGGTSTGQIDLTYKITDGFGCMATTPVTVQVTGASIANITGGTSPICPTATTTLTGVYANAHTPSWSSSNPAIATVVGGLVTGVAAGTVTITFTATEAGGCVGTATRSITVSSGPRPTISGNSAAPLCPGSTRPLSSTTSGLSISWNSSDPSVASVDAVTGIVTGVAFGTTVITYTVSDVSCTGSSTVAVVVGDGTRPTIGCPTPLVGVQNTDPGVCTKTFTLPPTSVTDNCAVSAVALTYELLNGLTVVGSGSLPNPFTLNVGTTAIRYIATDAGGNVSSCSFSITVADRQAPTVMCPADVTVNTGTSSCPVAVGSISPTSVTDNCGPVSAPVNYSYAGATTGTGVVSGSGTFDRGVTTATYSVTDASGNTGTCTFVVTVTDDHPATVTCPSDITVNTSAGICTGVLTTPQAAFTASDNCGSVTVTHTATGVTSISTPRPGSVAGTPFNMGSTVVTYTAVDQAGNTPSSCTFSVVVADNQPPTIQCPRPTPGTGPITWTLTADANCEASLINLNPVMNDNCGSSNLDLEYELIDQATGYLIDYGSGTADGLFYLGNTVVYYTATDDAGLFSSCSFNVEVLDLTKPVVTICPPNQVVPNTPGLCEAVLGSAVALAASDNCSGVTVSHISTGATVSSGAGDAQALPFLRGTTTVTYVVTDDSNNSTICRFTVEVQDTEFPDIICPAPMTVTAISNCTATLAAGSIDPSPTDNCPNATVQYSLNGTTWLPVPAPLTYAIGTRSIYYRVTDGAGRQSSCSFTVTVVDNTAPTLTCPTPTPLNTAPGVCTQTYTITDPITDNCPGSTWSAAFSNPVNSGVSSIGPINDGSNSVVTFPLGTTTVTLTATDGTNAATSCTFSVVVSDMQRPTLVCRGPLLPANVTQCSTIVTPTILDMRPLTLTDNCPAGLTIRANLSGATTSLGDELRPLADAANNWTFCVGTTNVIYTATDASGNSTTCAFSVTLREPTPPTFALCPPNLTISTDPGLCVHNNTSNFIAMGADNCDFGFTTSYSITGATTRSGTTGDASGVFNKGVSTITYRVVDASGNGNTTACITVVTINDTQMPVITCPTTPQVYTTRPGFCNALATGTAPTITENCPYTLSYQTSDSRSATNITDVNGLPFRPGLTTVRYLVTDGTNSSSCIFIIEVIDQQPPNITCPNDVTVTAAGSACTAVANGLTATFNDACSGVTLEHAITGATTPLVQPILGGAGGSTFNVGVSTVTYYAIDASSNVSSCMFTVTVRDAQRPTISCPTPAASYPTDPGICTATIPTLVATGTDNCGTAMLSFVRSSTTAGSGGPSSGMIDGGSAAFNIGTTVVTYTSTDAGGLTNSCSISVLVRDSQPPGLSCPTDNMVVSTNTNCTYVASLSLLELNATLVNDLCSATATLTYTLTGATTTPGRVTGQVGTRAINLGETQLTYFVADGSGNNSSCIVFITVNDNTNPTITCPSSTTASTAVNTCTATLFTLAPTATDNCGVASVHRSINGSPEVLGNANGVALSLGTNTITYTARDAGGRSSVCTFTVTVNDNTAPSFICPSPAPVSPGVGCTAMIPALVITATDNCAMGTFTYNLNGATMGSGNVSSIGTQLFSAGLTTVTYTATDASSNPRTCTFTVNVTDTQPPTLDCPSSQTVGTDPGVCTASALPVITATATDNCTASPTIAYSLNNGAFVTGATVSFPAGPYAPGVRSIRFRAVDNAGRVSTCDRTITVRDDVMPALTCPTPVNPYPSNASCQYVRAANEFSPAMSSDNCGTPTLTYTLTRSSVTSPVTSGALPAAFSGGTTTVTWLSRDAAGNTNSCSFDVIVSDLAPPTLTSCPANTTRSSTPGVCGYTVTATDLRPTATDNCGTPTLSWVASGASSGSGSTSASITGTVLSLGTTALQWTVTDVGGNATTCSFTVSVSDTQNPSITCKPSASRPGSLISSCTYQTIASEFDPTVSDNCSIASVTYAVGSGPATPQGTYPTLSSGINTIVWSATDVNARTSTCAMTITVSNCTFVNGNIVWKAAPAPSMSTLPVNNAIVNLTGAAVAATVTNTSGVYNFAVNGIGTFTITPTKTDNPMNGVDAADIAAIVAHVSGGAQITDPCNIIAADVQGNQNIDNNDASATNAAILGHAPSRALLRWIFVPRNHVFTPVSVNPSPVFTTIPPAFWAYPTAVTFTSTGGALPSYNFWGIHRGDVNNSTNLGSSSSSAAAEGQAMTLLVPDRMLKAGEIIRVPVSVRNFHDLAAYQFAFGFDVNQLEYVSVQTDGSALSLDAATNFGDSNADGGELRTLWAAGKGRALTDDARLFFVQFRVLQSGKRLSQVLRLDGTNLPAKAFDSGLLPQGVVLRFTDSSAPIAVAPASQGGIELMQNRPNPFTDQTIISFVLPQACEARLRIYDLSGRLMMETNKTYTAGYQEETIQLTAQQAMGGVYYYELTTPFGKAAKKMILADR